MDRRLAWTGAAIAVVSILSALMAQLPREEESLPSGEPVSNVEHIREAAREAEKETEEEAEYQFMLKEYEGRIGIYPYDGDQPVQVLDVQVKYLPDYDQILMAEGIPVKSYQELNSLIEDYTS